MSRTVTIGGFGHISALDVGGNAPVAVQTMWKDRLYEADLEEAAQRIKTLGSMGCKMLRFAVPDLPAAETLGHLAEMVSMPFAADIHFDHRIALRCLDFPIAKIRINPGNIGNKEKVKEVIEKAAIHNIPIRIGVNAGSLPADLRHQAAQGLDPADALVLAAEREMAIFDEYGYTNVFLSIKTSGITDTIIANRKLAQLTDIPIHIGITEAGPLVSGVAASSAALSVLLSEGIGDTLRVSLSDTMENEIIAAREICRSAAEIAAVNGRVETAGRLRQNRVKIISCPRCGRHVFDTHGFCERWLPRLYAIEKELTVAIMGCVVNGPEESRHADLGITGTGNKVLIFKHGQIVRTVFFDEADDAFAEELENM